MRHDKHHVLLMDGGHPSLELLRQYHEVALPPNLSHQVEKHLLTCEMCTDVVEGMAFSPAANTAAAITNINRRIAAKAGRHRKKRVVPAWQVAAALLLLLCTAVVVVYYNYSKLQQGQNTIAAEQEIIRSMDLAIPAAPELSKATVDSAAAPETHRIVAVIPPDKVVQKSVPSIAKQDKETVEEVVVEEVVVEEVVLEDAAVRKSFAREELAGVDSAAPAPAVPSPVDYEISTTESAPYSIAAAPTLAPESKSVSRALQGKVAGVTIRGLSSQKNNTAAAKVAYGQVLSEDGQPLPGVTVQLKGTGTGTTTDANGNFSLPVTGNKPTLLFHYIGYSSTEKAVAANTTPTNVSMEPDNRALSEVVVSGYSATAAGDATAVVAAKPASGRRAYKKYLKENLRLPVGSEGARGNVVVGFSVTASGEVSEVKVLKSLCPACDTEALRLIQEGPAWIPATQAGTPVPQQVKVSVPFKQEKR